MDISGINDQIRVRGDAMRWNTAVQTESDK
jgi:hypothetical protein